MRNRAKLKCRSFGLLTSMVVGTLLLFVGFSPMLSISSVASKNSSAAWVEFPVTQQSVLKLDVDQNVIIWDQSNHYSCANQSDTRRFSLPDKNWSGSYQMNGRFTAARSFHNNRSQQLERFPYIICAYNVQTGEFVTVVNEFNPDIHPRLSNDWVIYQRTPTGVSQIRARNLMTDEDIIISDSQLLNNQNSNIHDKNVVFHAEKTFEGEWAEAIMSYNLASRTLNTITISSDYSVDFPDVFDQTVVWQQATVGSYDFDIMGYDLSTGTAFTVSTQSNSEQYPRIDDNIVVWEADGDIYGHNMATGEYLTITQASGMQMRPSISADLVVWMDDRNGQWDIYAYDLTTNQEYQITHDVINEGYPEASGNLIAWIRQDNGIHAARKMSEFVFLPIIWDGS